jgi:hypothetical protein
LKEGQQTHILATINGDRTTVTIGVGQYVSLDGVLSYGTPPTSWLDTSHGIKDATINIQSLNSEGNTWSTVATVSTLDADPDNPIPTVSVGMFAAKLTPEAAGVYSYWVTYDGNSQYAPTVSNVVTLTVTNVAIS